MRKTENPTLRAVPSSGTGVMASITGHADTHPAQAVNEAAAPFPVDQQAPQGRAEVLLIFFFRAYCAFVVALCRVGAPPWLVEVPRYFLPNALMRAAARAHMRTVEQSPGKAGSA